MTKGPGGTMPPGPSPVRDALHRARNAQGAPAPFFSSAAALR